MGTTCLVCGLFILRLLFAIAECVFTSGRGVLLNGSLAHYGREVVEGLDGRSCGDRERSRGYSGVTMGGSDQ